MDESGGEASPASVPSPRPEAPCSAARQTSPHWPGGTRGSGGGDTGCAETPTLLLLCLGVVGAVWPEHRSLRSV